MTNGEWRMANDHQTRTLLIGFSAILVLSLLVGIAGNWYILVGIPAAVLFIYLSIVDFKKIFFLLFACIPLTMEVWLPNGTVTDLPTEPMQVLLMGIYFLYILKEGKNLRSDFVKHPISLLLFVWLGWTFFTTVTSENFIISFKFFLQKIWYVTTFYFLAGTLMKNEKDIKNLAWLVLVPLCFTALYTLKNHAALGFSFDMVNKTMHPFYRNKVAYACMLTVFLPFAWYLRKWYPVFSWKWFIAVGAILLMLVGVNYSYTRAAYATLVMAVGAYFVIRFRLMKLVLGGVVILSTLFVLNVVNQNNYLNFKPNYTKTITHDHFDDLLAATTSGQDVSTMERVFRWVAGGHMAAEKPWLGFGPGTFTYFYKSYTVYGFTTYVSDNTEGSGIHCYYLMVLVEQGILGALIFIALCFFVLLKGEQVYHRTSDPVRRRMLLMAMLTTVVIDGLLLMNDLVETDKVGSFFFLCMAIIVNIDMGNGKSEVEGSQPKVRPHKEQG